MWVRGQLLLMVIMGVTCGVAYVVLGVPSALLLALIAGICEAIPLVADELRRRQVPGSPELARGHPLRCVAEDGLGDEDLFNLCAALLPADLGAKGRCRFNFAGGDFQHFRDRNGTSYSVPNSAPYLSTRASVPCLVTAALRVELGPSEGGS